MGLRYPMLMHQTDTTIWIPISEKLPPSGFVLASTKHSVFILQYRKGQPHVTHSDFWMDQLGKKSDIRVEEVSAWAELPRPFWYGGLIGRNARRFNMRSLERNHTGRTGGGVASSR